jgi:hypothetical protein
MLIRLCFEQSIGQVEHVALRRREQVAADEGGDTVMSQVRDLPKARLRGGVVLQHSLQI